ncbi:MAG: hypothetical protein LAP40_22875 [Acidobacteriia bacterium]|nr:hypothetical protein [Terriglobia bacterium]
MQSIHLRLAVDQIKALLEISHVQLFHLKYLDPKIPGYKAEPGELKAAESAVRVLEAALQEDRLRTPSAWEAPARRGLLVRVK